MSIIDNHFYFDLFVERKVGYFNDIYLSLFDMIWPRSKNFEKFLESSDSSIKTECAKKILQDIVFSCDVFLPAFTVLNVLNDQYRRLKERSDGYTPQDHVVHSVHLYVLGVYLLFNSKKLNKKIIKTDTSFYTTIKEFILKWQVFSFFHDVGYYFEDGDLKDKDIADYVSVYDALQKTIISKNLTRAYALKALYERYSSALQEKGIRIKKGVWYRYNGERASEDSVQKMISSFAESVSIDIIGDDEDLNQILPILENKNHLVLVYNGYGNCVMILNRDADKIIDGFSTSEALFDDLIDDVLLNDKRNYSFKYFLFGLQDDSTWEKTIDDRIAINSVFSQLPKGVANGISIDAQSVQDVFFLVNDWITSEIVDDINKEKAKYQQAYNLCLTESFMSVFNRVLKKNLGVLDIQLLSLEHFYKEQISNLQKNQTSIINEIMQEAEASYSEKHAITHIFINYYSECLSELSRVSGLQDDETSLSFLCKKGTEVFVLPLAHDNKNVFQTSLLQLMEVLSKQLGTSIDKLTQYKPPFAQFDHGILSGALLYQSICYCYDIWKYCTKNEKLSLAWNCFNSEKEKLPKICADIIFAVLIHNVYNKKSRSEFGVDYMHDIDTNPFSYFCALCDTLQKWGRPKKVNLARTVLPNYTYLEDEFNIEMKNGNINIKCLKENIDNINGTIQSSEKFLPGISKLVEVSEF